MANPDTTKQSTAVICHYDVLEVPRDADLATIKKHHRKKALKYHPDKNLGDDSAAEQFRLVQQAYECLSDPQERKWYDDHRDAILAGWTTTTGDDKTGLDMLFQVAPFMHPGCYYGYDDDNEQGFYHIYKKVFEDIVRYECQQTDTVVELPTNFGSSSTDWHTVQSFYQCWESFASALNFAWEDKFNVHEDAPNRRVRRLMEDENKKARKNAKKEYNQDIVALVAFVKRRDPRVKAKRAELEEQKLKEERKRKEELAARKLEQQRAKEAWKQQAQQEMEDAEEEDRLAGRIRLADLEDDYDYGGGKKKKKRGKKKNKKKNVSQDNDGNGDNDDNDDNENEMEDSATNNESQEAEVQENGDRPTEIDTDKTEGSDIREQDDGDDGQKNDPLQDSTDNNTLETQSSMINNGMEESLDEPEHLESSSDEEEIEWRCECCRKDFKSEGQMENHMKSKKHKAAWKKYQTKLQREQEEDDEILNDIVDELVMSS